MQILTQPWVLPLALTQVNSKSHLVWPLPVLGQCKRPAPCQKTPLAQVVFVSFRSPTRKTWLLKENSYNKILYQSTNIALYPGEIRMSISTPQPDFGPGLQTQTRLQGKKKQKTTEKKIVHGEFPPSQRTFCFFPRFFFRGFSLIQTLLRGLGLCFVGLTI